MTHLEQVVGEILGDEGVELLPVVAREAAADHVQRVGVFAEEVRR